MEIYQAPQYDVGQESSNGENFKDKKHIKGLVIIFSILPVVYIWCLPWLQAAGYAFDSPTYFNQTQSGLPIYYTVSGFITSPQAAGGWTAAWFFPLMFLWLAPSIRSDRFAGCSFCLLFTMTICFSLFNFSPITYNILWHSIMTLLFGLNGLMYLCREACHGMQNKLSWVFLILAIIGFGGLFAPMEYKIGYGFWAFESVGLSGFALYMPSVIYYGSNKLKEEEQKSDTSPLQMKVRHSFGFKCFLAVGTILPIIFFWSLPYLTTPIPYFNADQGFTNALNSTQIHSFSNYVNNAQATGGLGASLYLPLFFMWMAPIQQGISREEWFDSRHGRSLMCLTYGFFFYLAFPIGYNETMHTVGVVLFWIGVFFFFTFQKRSGMNNPASNGLYWLMQLCFILIDVFYFLFIFKEYNIGKSFYYIEAMAFTSMILISPSLILDDELMNNSNLHQGLLDDGDENLVH